MEKMDRHFGDPGKRVSLPQRIWRWLKRLFGAAPAHTTPVQTSAGEPEEEGSFFQDPLWESYGPGQLLYQRIASEGSVRSYRYCGVIFYKADNVYHYLYKDVDLKVGDRVLVPVHVHGSTQIAEGIVVSAGEYLEDCVPHPLGQTSYVIRKL